MNIFRLSTLLILFSAFTFAPKPIVLEHKFQAGDMYEWKQSTTQNMKQSIPGAGEMNTETKSESYLVVKILEVTKTVSKAEVSIAKMKVDTKSTYGNVSLDSEGDQNLPMNKVLKSIASTTVIAYISKTGAVEKFEGLEKYQAGIDALGLDANTLPAAKQVGEQFASESALKTNLEQSLLQYPAGKVNIGDVWKTSTMAPMSIPIRTDNTWKLSAVEGKIVSLENDGIVVTADSTKEFTAGGYRARANMNGRVAARAKADLVTGMPSEIKGISEIKGSITLLAGPGIPGDMEIPTEIVTEVEQTVIKK